jgi:hypothetical protein
VSALGLREVVLTGLSAEVSVGSDQMRPEVRGFVSCRSAVVAAEEFSVCIDSRPLLLAVDVQTL